MKTKLTLYGGTLQVKIKKNDIWLRSETGCGNARLDLFLEDADVENLLVMLCNAKKKAMKYKAKISDMGVM